MSTLQNKIFKFLEFILNKRIIQKQLILQMTDYKENKTMPNSITKSNVLCFLFWIGCCVQKLRTQHYKPGLVVSSNLGRCR